MLRPAYRAGLFYPRYPAECRAQLERCLAEATLDGTPGADPVAALVPHAGWVYSGRVAAGALRALATRSRAPRVIVLFGAVHVPGVGEATLSDASGWETPLGVARVDPEAAAALAEVVATGGAPHAGEHSLEVEVPFLQALFPEATILPVAVPPDDDAAAVGRRVAAALEHLGDDVVFVGSTDMSHYGPRFGFADHGEGAAALRWVREENDARMVELMLAMREGEVVAEAHANWNACGSGAVAATLAAARDRGKTAGVLTGYTTSADVQGEPEPDSFVGYAGVVY